MTTTFSCCVKWLLANCSSSRKAVQTVTNSGSQPREDWTGSIIDSELCQTFGFVDVFKIKSCVRTVRKIWVLGTAALPQDQEFFIRKYFTIRMLVTASLLVHERHFSQRFSQAFKAVFERVAVAKTPLCLRLDFSGDDGALLPRLARL